MARLAQGVGDAVRERLQSWSYSGKGEFLAEAQATQGWYGCGRKRDRQVMGILRCEGGTRRRRGGVSVFTRAGAAHFASFRAL